MVQKYLPVISVTSQSTRALFCVYRDVTGFSGCAALVVVYCPWLPVLLSSFLFIPNAKANFQQ